MSAASMNKALWSSAYRTMFLPYRLEKISFIPEVTMDVFFKSKYNYLILNRNYRVISDIGDVNFCGYSSVPKALHPTFKDLKNYLLTLIHLLAAVS